jgi:integrase
MARVSEINRLMWEDVDLEQRYVILYTRKKMGGHLTPRKVPMTQTLFNVLQRRHADRDPDKPWVFWHRYWSRKAGQFVEGPYGDRKKLMKRLCKKAKVRYFRFHPLRHSGASIMDGNNVPIGAIQRILGYENRRTTEIYLHSIGDLEREAIGVFEKARKKSQTDSHTGIQE